MSIHDLSNQMKTRNAFAVDSKADHGVSVSLKISYSNKQDVAKSIGSSLCGGLVVSLL